MTSRILIVEDDCFMREAVDLILTQAGFICSSVGTGESALDLLKRSMPDVILLDINLPGLSGLTLLQRLRERRITVPILMLTANASPGVVREVMDRGGNGYILKPFEPADLVGRVRAALAPPGGKQQQLRALRHR